MSDYRNREIVVILYCVGFREWGNRCYLVLREIPGIGKSLLSCTVLDSRNREIVVILLLWEITGIGKSLLSYTVLDIRPHIVVLSTKHRCFYTIPKMFWWCGILYCVELQE